MSKIELHHFNTKQKNNCSFMNLRTLFKITRCVFLHDQIVQNKKALCIYADVMALFEIPQPYSLKVYWCIT